MEKLERRDVSHYKVEKTAKDAPLKESVEKVRTMINLDREGTKYKPLSYMATFMKLRRAGYTTANKVDILMGSVRDAEVPVRNLFYRLKI